MNKSTRLAVESLESRALMSAAAADLEPVPLTFTIEERMPTSWRASAGDRPTESLSINFTKITFNTDTIGGTFSGVPEDDPADRGVRVAGYDLKTAKKV